MSKPGMTVGGLYGLDSSGLSTRLGVLCKAVQSFDEQLAEHPYLEGCGNRDVGPGDLPDLMMWARRVREQANELCAWVDRTVSECVDDAVVDL